VSSASSSSPPPSLPAAAAEHVGKLVGDLLGRGLGGGLRGRVHGRLLHLLAHGAQSVLHARRGLVEASPGSPAATAVREEEGRWSVGISDACEEVDGGHGIVVGNEEDGGDEIRRGREDRQGRREGGEKKGELSV